MPILKFRAPNVSLATPLEFEVSVTDAHSKNSSGAVHILVKDVTSTGSRANAPSAILNHTVLSQYTGGIQNNVKIPDSSRSNFSGPGVPNATTTQSKNLMQSTVVPTSSSIRDVNDTSMSTQQESTR